MLENLEGSESELRNQEQENTFSLRNDIIHLLSAFRHNNCQNNDVFANEQPESSQIINLLKD